MNDHDELASAYLDDEVTTEERARVDGDPVLRARVEELRAARDAVASAGVEPPAPAARDAAIRVAVDASLVVDLAAVRARRRLWLASIAAATLLLIGAAGILIRSQSNNTSATSTAVGSAPSTTAPGGPMGAFAPAANSIDGPGQLYGTAALGSFSDRAALVTAVRTAVGGATSSRSAAADTTAAPNAASGAAAPACTVAAPADSAGQLLTATAVLDGTPVQVYVFALHDGSRRMLVTTGATCDELFSQTL